MKDSKPKPGKWSYSVIETKGYCRNCWGKFHQSIKGPIDGLTLNEIQNAVGQQIRCCSNPDIRLIPV